MHTCATGMGCAGEQMLPISQGSGVAGSPSDVDGSRIAPYRLSIITTVVKGNVMVRQRSPLEPAATSVHVFLALVGTLVGIGVLATVFGSGSVFGIGSSDICVDAVNGRGVSVPQSESNVVLDAENGVRSLPATVRICVESPTVGQRLLGVAAQAPTFLVFVGALLLAARLIRGATRDGIFTQMVAKRLRMLGWFVLVGEAAASLVEAQARNWLTNTMIGDRDTVFTVNDWDVPLMALFLGAVLISMGRIMRFSTMMREDLEGTV